MSELHMYHFIFHFSICDCTVSTCSFVVFTSDAVAHNIILLLKKSISYFMSIMYRHIFLNFGVISFVEMHTYKFGIVYFPEVSVGGSL